MQAKACISALIALCLVAHAAAITQVPASTKVSGIATKDMPQFILFTVSPASPASHFMYVLYHVSAL